MLKSYWVGFIMAGISIMNKYYNLGNILIRNRELGQYSNNLVKDKEEELVLLLLNVNDLQLESQKAKNDIIREFLIKYKADIITFQEVNLNWNRVPLRYQQKAKSIGQWETS